MPSKADEARKIAKKSRGIKERRTVAYQSTEDRKDDEAVKELLQQIEQNIESEANDGNFHAILRVGKDVKDNIVYKVRDALESEGFRAEVDKKGIHLLIHASWSGK